jgi:hypothetical protein
MARTTKLLFAFAQYDGKDEKVEAVYEVRLKKWWIEHNEAFNFLSHLGFR